MLVSRNFGKTLIKRSINMVARTYQVTVMGGASDIGQVISLMLRAEPMINKLVVHDQRPDTAGIIQDLSHIPVNSSLQGYSGNNTLDRALKGSDLVLLAGGAIETPGVTKQARMDINTAFVQSAAVRVGKLTPMPFVGIVTEPINVLVPMAAEIMRNHGKFDPKKLFGITTVDWLRAQSLLAAHHQLPPMNCFVPVIGGHSDDTTIPLISHSRPGSTMSDQDVIQFTAKVQNYEQSVTEAKQGWSPTMCVAYSVLLFTREIIHALEGRPTQVSAFVDNNDFGTSYFSGLVNIDKNGVIDMQRFTNLSQYECHLLEKATAQLRKDVAMGKKILEIA